MLLTKRFFEENIIEKILASISYSDRLSARLVSRQWNDEICSKFSFRVRINDKSEEFDRILNLPLYSITVENLTQELDWALKRLKIPQILAEVQIKGRISLANFETFVNGAARLGNLTRLGIHCDEIGEENRKIVGISKRFGFGVAFPVLKALTLRPPSSPCTESLSKRVFNLFLLSKFQDLEEFSVENAESLEKCTESVKRLFKFLCRHGSTLRTVSITQTPFEDRPVRVRTFCETSLHLRQLKTIALNQIQVYLRQGSRFRFQKSVLQLTRLVLAPPPALEEPLAAMLYRQRRLEQFHSNFYHCPFQYYKSVLLRNYATLKELVLNNLSCRETSRKFHSLDLTPFRYCTVLQFLTLVRAPDDLQINQDHALTNVKHLPSSLRFLKVSGFGILSDEIYEIGTLLTDLTRLELLGAGDTGSVGVTGRGLKHLLENLEHLEHLKIDGVNVQLQEDLLTLQVVLATIQRYLVTARCSSASSITKWCKGTLEWNFKAKF